MRPPADERRIRELAHRLGQLARTRVRIYLTGGATAVLEGWREATIGPGEFNDGWTTSYERYGHAHVGHEIWHP